MSAPVVILGAGGRLGAALKREWEAAGEQVIAFDRRALDLSDLDGLRIALERIDFAVLVNCAAQTNVDRCEEHPEEAFRINSEAVGVIGRVCAGKHARCIHIGTDYVFDGDKRQPYTEEDAALPIGVYGASKLSGEEALLNASPDHLAVRVSWVFGPDRPSFIDQILQRATEQEQAGAVSDKWAVPTYTLDLAQHLRLFLRDVKSGGLLHLCNRGECTWQEYGQYALDCAREAGVALRASAVSPMAMADIKAFVAKRPPYTVLSTAKFTALTGHTPRPWQDAVRTYVTEWWAPRAALQTKTA